MRPLRLPPLAGAPLTVVSLILLLAGGIPVATFPFLALDASHYRTAIGVAAMQCAGNPVPAPSGCWSATQARVTIVGIDHTESGDVDYMVLDVAGREPVRENVVEGVRVPEIDARTVVTARFWGDAIVQVLPPAATGAAPVTLPTRDNPSYRAAHFPTGSAVAAALGLLGLAAFGIPLFLDVRRLRARRRIDAEAEQAAREAQYTPGFARGLARYGMSLAAERPREATIVGEDAWEDSRTDTPPTLAAAQEEATHPHTVDALLKPGGAGWNIRTR